VLAKIPLYFDEEARLPGIGVVISTHESVSYAIGYRRGRRGILIKCPWWADMIAYDVAQMDGYRAYIGAHDERPAHVELRDHRQSGDWEPARPSCGWDGDDL
jgi:hypothetical protein